MSYVADSNNADGDARSQKQVPARLRLDKEGGGGLVGKALTVTGSHVHDRADQVIINTSGSYHFLYDILSTNQPLGAGTAKHGSNITGSDAESPYLQAITVGANEGPIVLDINPIAWSGSSGVAASNYNFTGDVTFIYRGKY